jgi:hypothetical protein
LKVLEAKLHLSRVHKKLAEADFFFGKMCGEEPRFIGDKEPFDYYLSAFLNAGRTVDYRLIHAHGGTYKPWRDAWRQRLAAGEDRLIEFMFQDRNIEVHATGSNRSRGQEGVEFGIGEHRLPRGQGMIQIGGPPGMPPATLYRPTYSFTIDGTDRKAIEACRAYLALLHRMVEQFEADHP